MNKFKKIVVIISIGFVCLVPSSCKKTSTLTISDYIKPKENTVYIYNGPKERLGDWTVFYDYIGEDKVQRRIITSLATFTEVLSFADGELKMTNGAQQIADYADRRNYFDNSDIILLKEPLSLDASWVQSKLGNNGVKTKITGVDVEVTVPYGTFKALEVTTIYNAGQESEINYYAEDIGLIKTISVGSGIESVSELSQIQENQGLSELMPIFYLNAAKDGIEYEVISAVLQTNSNLAELYGQVARDFISDKFGITLNENIKINSIKKEENNSKVTVDFNSYAIEEMNKIADVKTEELILQCAANYFGFLYRVNDPAKNGYIPIDVLITIDGETYKSNQIQKQPGEVIVADIGNAAQAE